MLSIVPLNATGAYLWEAELASETSTQTKDGNIVGNVLIEAHDVGAAKVKLFKRYPSR
jgi:hypothetical protein